MSTAVETPALPALLTSPIEARERLTLDNIDWAAYTAIGHALRDRPGLRQTYSHGRLELMTTSFGHERIIELIGRLIDVLTEELEIGVAAGGSTTFKLEGAERGVEPDQCYYAANLARVRHKTEIDLTVDPPPDLVIEVEVSNAAVAKMSIYAAFGVPELWRWADGTIRVYELAPDRTYHERPASTAFAVEFDPAEFVRFFSLAFSDSEQVMARAFRAWLRQWIADRGLASH